MVQPRGVAETRYGDVSALPADVWLRIANAVAFREEWTCSWPLVACAIAMPCIRRALALSSSAGDSDAPLVSLMRSSLFPTLSSLTSIDFYFSRSQPSPPRLLYFLSQAPRLESLLLEHGVASDDENELARHRCNDAIMNRLLHITVAPRLSALNFHWHSRRSRLLLLPTCPAHLTPIFLRTDWSCPWAIAAPHVTSLVSLCTNMHPEKVARLSRGVVETVKALEWRDVPVGRSLDLSAWQSLRCFHAVGWGAVSLSVLHSGVVWPCGLEGLFVDSIASDVADLLDGGLRGGDGGEGFGTGGCVTLGGGTHARGGCNWG
ncbi:unnamed protein product [Closterium sp. NIES-64]|nr:unnamed protein product [Closterium sp. NIES-64]